ncbi:MAG: hypothetical protein ING40_04815 [Burkholderiales bacterium]|jgi:hypothetical protein|nr:hypothetical protein [Burkholderiales bacterium]MCA3228341.1 hypothetical protein [Burkholderiales bacterium]
MLRARRTTARGRQRIVCRQGPALHAVALHEAGAAAEVFFERTHCGLMRVPMMPREGRCRAADDGTLVMQMISGSDAARTVSVEGNTMEIRGGAKTMRLSAVIAR